jgi:FKBP-type peptidyl-prolyl cis-trans isomerase
MMLLAIVASIALSLQPPPDAEVLTDEISTQLLAPGTGTVHPEASDYVRIHYTRWSLDGKKLDEVLAPLAGTVAVNNLGPGWRKVMDTMVVGEQRRAWLRGDKLIIDTELLAIVHPPATPADLAAPPADATKTRSGLAYKVLVPGTGDKHPSRRSKVRVHYSGWTTDGKMFDSSVVRDQPAEFPVDAVIAGWTEGLQQMTVGEVARFWIPAKLAYEKDASKPQGMLVFDIQLLEIK